MEPDLSHFERPVQMSADVKSSFGRCKLALTIMQPTHPPIDLGQLKSEKASKDMWHSRFLLREIYYPFCRKCVSAGDTERAEQPPYVSIAVTSLFVAHKGAQSLYDLRSDIYIFPLTNSLASDCYPVQVALGFDLQV